MKLLWIAIFFATSLIAANAIFSNSLRNELQQRIAIIRSLQQPFDFLLLDEPFSHLDESNRKKAMELMEEEADVRKASIILADLKAIEYFNADKTLHL